MVTLKGYTANYAGKSTDIKPTDVEINTVFHELDTDKYYYFDGTQWNEIPNTGGGGGGGFTPTTEQLAAMNSGITAEKLQTDENNISLLQGKVKAHSEGGTDYDVINGIRVYVSATAPTGDIPTGSLWIGG